MERAEIGISTSFLPSDRNSSLEMDSQLSWLPNIWMGVSVENQDYTFRISHLRRTRAHEVSFS